MCVTTHLAAVINEKLVNKENEKSNAFRKLHFLNLYNTFLTGITAYWNKERMQLGNKSAFLTVGPLFHILQHKETNTRDV